MPFLYKLKVFLTACRNTAAYCIFLTFGTPDSGTKFRRYQVFIRYHGASRWNDKGKQAVKTKAECFKAWRLFLLSSLFLSNMHYWPSVRSIWPDIWPNSFFCILLFFLEVLYFFLVGYAMKLRRFLRDLMHWSSLCSLLRTDEWSTWSKSSILFTETKSRQMKKERHQYPSILTEQAWSKKGLFILWTSYCGFDSQRFVLLLFSILRVGRPPRHWFISFSRLPFPASFA